MLFRPRRDLRRPRRCVSETLEARTMLSAAAPAAEADKAAPVAGVDLAVTSPGAAVVIADVLANDHDPDGGALAVAGFTQPAHGSVAQTGPGSFTYTPDPGFNGPDAFTYTLADDTGATATGTVRVGVGTALLDGDW